MKIGYEFKDKKLLDLALTHISYGNVEGIENNQRLEFLGDSILSFVVAEYIYENFKDLDEGRLTEIRAGAVCEKALADVAEEIGLEKLIRLDRSEAWREKVTPSILCDTYEAVLGAIYLDSDIETARRWILGNLTEKIDAASRMDFRNYKSEIQNFFQKRDKGREVVGYELVEKTGPDHMPVFKVNAVYKGKVIGTGTGTSRKDAEKSAAKEACGKYME